MHIRVNLLYDSKNRSKVYIQLMNTNYKKNHNAYNRYFIQYFTPTSATCFHNIMQAKLIKSSLSPILEI